MKNFDSIMPWDTMFDYSDLMRKLRRIERLTYYQECYLNLAFRSNADFDSCSYYERMALRCKSKLNDLGVVITDVNNKHHENEV